MQITLQKPSVNIINGRPTSLITLDTTTSFKTFKRSNTKNVLTNPDPASKQVTNMSPPKRIGISIETTSLMTNKLRNLAIKGRLKIQEKNKVDCPPKKSIFNTKEDNNKKVDFDSPVHIEGVESMLKPGFLERYGKNLL